MQFARVDVRVLVLVDVVCVMLVLIARVDICAVYVIDHSLWSNCDRVSMRSLVVVEDTSIVFHTRLLQFSIYQLLEYNKLEVSLEE